MLQFRTFPELLLFPTKKRGIMRQLSSCLRKTVLSAALCLSAATANTELKPLHAGIALEYGKMENLTFFEPAGNTESYTINRSIGWIVQEATIEERLDVSLVLGGLFFQFFPFNKGFDYSKVRNSAVSLGQASAKYKFGDISDPSLSISFGLMPYKYNPDSRNLGEYLFRSTPYPNTTINGSWDYVNSSYSKTKGILVEKDLFEGKWKNDVILSLSDEVYPLNDLSLAYTTSFTMGIVDLGAGVNFKNLIANSPSITTRKSPFNSYFTYQGKTYYGDDTYYKQIATFFKDDAAKRTLAGDATGAAASTALETGYNRDAFVVDSLFQAEKVAPIGLKREYYTYAGTLIMGRASVNLGSLISENCDLKLYTELDVLGLANYPIFYENRSERMPIMLGLTIPTFGLLDYLAVEVEQWKNPYPIIYVSALTPGFPKVDYGEMRGLDLTKPYTKDDLKWSIATKKSVGKYFSINAQIANDHTRPIRYDFSPYKYETMLDSKAYYYVLQLQVNM